MAPKLHYADDGPSLDDGWQMIVMEYVLGKSRALSEITKRHYDVIAAAITLLHEKGLVFGDLRLPNILLPAVPESVAQLLDFDWNGREGVVRYPVGLNPGHNWPSGIVDGGLVAKEHNLAWLREMEPRPDYPGKQSLVKLGVR